MRRYETLPFVMGAAIPVCPLRNGRLIRPLEPSSAFSRFCTRTTRDHCGDRIEMAFEYMRFISVLVPFTRCTRTPHGSPGAHSVLSNDWLPLAAETVAAARELRRTMCPARPRRTGVLSRH